MFDKKDAAKGGDVCFSTNGKGKWWKRTSAMRCTEGIFLHSQCQGILGHKGLHWCYDESGSYCWADNAEDPKEDGCSGNTPPDHKDYISPPQMMEYYHGNLGSDFIEVIDPAELARLNAGQFGEDESIISPANIKSMFKSMLDSLEDRLLE